MVASISSSFTSQVASHGAYAVFGLMLIDAVLPAASELVMLYAGAAAAGCALLRLDPGRRLRDGPRAVQRPDAHRLGDLGVRDRGRRLRTGLELRTLQPRLPLRRIRRPGRRSRIGGVSHLSINEQR